MSVQVDTDGGSVGVDSDSYSFDDFFLGYRALREVLNVVEEPPARPDNFDPILLLNAAQDAAQSIRVDEFGGLLDRLHDLIEAIRKPDHQATDLIEILTDIYPEASHASQNLIYLYKPYLQNMSSNYYFL